MVMGAFVKDAGRCTPRHNDVEVHATITSPRRHQLLPIRNTCNDTLPLSARRNAPNKQPLYGFRNQRAGYWGRNLTTCRLTRRVSIRRRRLFLPLSNAAGEPYSGRETTDPLNITSDASGDRENGDTITTPHDATTPLPSASTDIPDTCYEVSFPSEDIRNTILLDHYANPDGTLDIFVSGVAHASRAELVGIRPGHILRQVSNPMRAGEMWVMGEHPRLFERLRYVKGVFTSAHAGTHDGVKLILDKEPRITAAMVKDAGGSPSAARLTDRYDGDSTSTAEERTADDWMRTERPDLYSNSWAGGEWTGGSWNELTILMVLVGVVTAIGLTFAFATQGTLWNVNPYGPYVDRYMDPYGQYMDHMSMYM